MSEERRPRTAAPATSPAHGGDGPAFPPRLLVFLLVLLGALGLGGLELGGDQSIILGAQIDLVIEIGADRGAVGLVAGLQMLLALESLDLLNGDLELVGDPGVGASLADPAADAVQLRSE